MSMLFVLSTCALGLSMILRFATVRYIWRSSIGSGSETGLSPPPNYLGYPRRLLSEMPPSKIALSSKLYTLRSYIKTLTNVFYER